MAFNARLQRERRLEAAEGYLTLGMIEHALEELAQIDDPERCPFDFYRIRGEALRESEDYAPAVESFERALAEDPEDLTVLMGLAWCYKRLDQLSRSIDSMEEAYQYHPDEPIVLYNLACYFALAGKRSLSLSWLGRALRMEPHLRKLIPDESDFDSLRDDADFQFLVGAAAGTARKA